MKCFESLYEERNSTEESDICDITPAFPFLTFSVEVEVLHSLESALELWMEISEDTNQNCKILSEKVEDFDLLSVISATAEIFATSVHVSVLFFSSCSFIFVRLIGMKFIFVKKKVIAIK